MLTCEEPEGGTDELSTFLVSHQVIQFVGLLFGEDVSLDLPHPGADMDGFLSSLRLQLSSAKPQFNVITRKVEPLINLGRLKSHLKVQMGTGGGCVIL